MERNYHHMMTHQLPSGEEVMVMQTEESLRDWFAGYAMGDAPYNKFDVENNAEWSYKYADAMLAARVKVKE